MSTFILALILAFLSPFRGKVLTFLGATVKKGGSRSRVELSPLEPLAGPRGGGGGAGAAARVTGGTDTEGQEACQ